MTSILPTSALRLEMRPGQRRLGLRGLLAGAAVAALIVAAAPAFADNPEPEWHPESSERLVKLPANYLKKSLDRDFAESALGTALQGIDQDVGAKAKTLADLQGAIAKSSGATQVELRHQFLHEKRAYVEMMSHRNELERKHVAIQIHLLEDVLGRMRPELSGKTPAQQELVKRQDAARARFESSLETVDMRLFDKSSAPESKYGVQYAQNSAAIEQLVARIKTHKMNDTGSDGDMTKEDYVRQMLADTQAQAALIDQEDTILGYMAKLVALDALQLADEVEDPMSGDVAPREKTTPAAMAPLFVSN